MLRKRIIAAVMLSGLAGGFAASMPASANLARSDGPARDGGHAWNKDDGSRSWDKRDGGHAWDEEDEESAVFVQTNKPLGNTIQVFDRADDGELTPAGEYQTGGLGGATVGPPVDALASQGSLIYHEGLLFAVNAGSNTVTVFRVDGDELERLDVVWSGGLLPVSIAVHDDLVYVLNAGGDGAVQGYRLEHGKLLPIRGSNRSLGLGNANPPAFADAPAQVGVDPDGRFVLVSTKSHDLIEAFRIDVDGRLSKTPNSSPSETAPFGFTFDEQGKLLVAESGSNAVTRYRLSGDGTLTQIGPSVPNNQTASCWIQRVGEYFYVANAGSSTISSYRVDDEGNLVLVAAVAVDTGGGAIDMTESDGFLYVQNAAAGNVQGYAVNDDGSLTLVTTVGGLPQFADGIGMEGIAAS
jgi:6-phosphogluconolactonase (cycloisomerase 2 family)